MWEKAFSLGLVLLIAAIYVNKKLYEYNIICSNTQIQESISEKLCQDIQRSPNIAHNYISSYSKLDICDILCQSDIHLICQSYHLSKPKVFIVDGISKEDAKKIVIKQVIDHELDSQAYWNQSGPNVYIPTQQEFEVMVTSHIDLVIGRSSPRNLLLENPLYHTASPVSLQKHRSFWKLLNDHEYLLSQIFEHLRIFPRLYGTCDHFYAVEYVEPSYSKYMCTADATYKFCLEKTIALIAYIEKLDSVWDEPFQLCDVKPEHFGWSTNGEILFLDLDSVETKSALETIMELTPECSSNEDCSYFDCHGRCLSSGKCEPVRVNTNLQVVCQKILEGSSDIFSYSSNYLDSNQASQFLKEAIQLCSTNPGMGAGTLLNTLQQELDYLSR